MYYWRFRQVHLDFHTSPHIPNIGGAFDKKQWQEALRKGHVNSINIFAKCHHGWSYHPPKVGKAHPHLKINLLRAQIDACKEIGVTSPIYISAGADNMASDMHPEWREVYPDGHTNNLLIPGFHKLCFNSPYVEYLCEQIREVNELFPDGDGIWLDIIHQNQCCCKWCMAVMEKEGLNADVEADRIKCSKIALERYYTMSTAAARSRDPRKPVFHNSGHIFRGDRNLLKYVSHLELESLPTGGWGYDHFPISAKYCKNLGVAYIGMTGKFHTTWGEFGGFKHPNALRYECAAMLAYGSTCCIGDQLHPEGKMDESTYSIIGQAYAEVETKEPWCGNVDSVADVGLLSSAAVHRVRESDADIGANRVLLEGHLLFDVLDAEMDFSPYKVIILPDNVTVSESLKNKLNKYLAGGGKLFLTGQSGLDADKKQFVFDIGAQHAGDNEFAPNYCLPTDALRPSFVNSPMVMYCRSQNIKVTTGKSLGQVYNSYFNRSYKHFCSHQHTPNQPQPSGFDCGVLNGNILYLAHPVFTNYRAFGAVAYKDYIVKAIKLLLGNDITLTDNLPSPARVTVMEQKQDRRYILHLLYAPTITRGGNLQHDKHLLVTPRDPGEINVIEDVIPLHNIHASVKVPQTVKKVTLEPQGRDIPFEMRDGRVSVKVDSFEVHQMVVLHY